MIMQSGANMANGGKRFYLSAVWPYLTDEQHRHGGWIGSIKCEVIFARALSTV